MYIYIYIYKYIYIFVGFTGVQCETRTRSATSSKKPCKYTNYYNLKYSYFNDMVIKETGVCVFDTKNTDNTFVQYYNKCVWIIFTINSLVLFIYIAYRCRVIISVMQYLRNV